MSSIQKPSIGQALARRLARKALALVVIAAGLHAFLLHQSYRDTVLESLKAQARLCAAAMIPGPRGDLSRAVEQLQGRHAGIIAVGMLNSYRQLGLVYPQRPAHRMAATAAYGGRRIIHIDHPLTGEKTSVIAVAVPLNGDPSSASQLAMFVLRVDAPPTGWMKASLRFAGLIGLVAVVGVVLTSRWFERRVVKPLQELASATDLVLHPIDEPITDTGGWAETALLAQRIGHLREELAEREDDVQSVEIKMVQQLQKNRVGFDRQLRRVKDEAAVDALTRLRNRAFLETELEPLFDVAKRRKTDLTAVMIDIDNFKQYNDSYGHQAGDALLRFVGMLLRGSIRPTDHGIRYGGDEFLLLLPETEMREAQAVAERLVKLFGQYVKRLDHKHQLSFSAGIACRNISEPESGHTLVTCADNALYLAKREGKNQIARHQPTVCLQGAV